MSKNYRRIGAGVLAAFMIFFVTGAFAFVPLLLASTRLAGVVMKTNTGQQLAITGALAVGTAITYMMPTRTDSASTVRDDPLYFVNTPRPVTATEAAAGWTQAASGVQPVPPSSLPATATYQLYTTGGLPLDAPFASVVLACERSRLVSAWYASNPYTIVVVNANTSRCDYGGGNTFNVNMISSCPAGYTLSGVNCTLSNAAIVQKPADGQCSIVRVGNAYSADANDPDCADGHAPVITTDANGSTISYTGSDGSSFVGNFTSADGKQTMIYTMPFPSSNTTERTTVNLNPPLVPGDPPTIAGVKKEVLQGLGSAATTPIAQAVTVNTPIDYSKAGEATQAASAIIAAQAADAATVPVAVQDQTLQAALTARAAIPADISMVVDSSPIAGPSIFQPFTPAACQPLSYSFSTPLTAGQHTVTLDICPHVDTIKNIFSWVLYLTTAALLFQMFTRRPDGVEG